MNSSNAQAYKLNFQVPRTRQNPMALHPQAASRGLDAPS
jgi:hypothetical protein